MNLARHISVLWRFRAIVLAGVLLGLILAFLAAFQVPSMERRGTESWTAMSDVQVTQQGFPEGRVTPCVPTVGGTGTETQTEGPCADQGRFVQLALYYAQIAVSDEVRRRLPDEIVNKGAIEARNVDATGNGQGWLPIIKLTTTSNTAEGAVRLNQATIEAMEEYLTSNQKQSQTPQDDRVRLVVINQPAAALLSGRSLAIPMAAFLLCILAAIAVAHIFENLRPQRGPDDYLDPSLDFDVAVANGNGHGHPVAWPEPAEMHGETPSGRRAR